MFDVLRVRTEETVMCNKRLTNSQ